MMARTYTPHVSGFIQKYSKSEIKKKFSKDFVPIFDFFGNMREVSL